MARGKDNYRVAPIVNLAKAALYVRHRTPFDGGGCFARKTMQTQRLGGYRIHDETTLMPTMHTNYVVYSGEYRPGMPNQHASCAVPLFVYDEHAAMWFENSDPIWGKSTTRQRMRLRPPGEIHTFQTEVIECIAQWGFAEVARTRMSNQRNWRDELRGYLALARGKQTDSWRDAYNKRMDREVNTLVWRDLHVLNNRK